MSCISDLIDQSKEKIQSYLRSLATQIMPMRGDHPCTGKFIYYPLTVKRFYPDIHTQYGESIDAYEKRCAEAIRTADEFYAGKKAIRAVVTALVGGGKTFFSAKLCHACLFSDREFFSSCVELTDGENDYVPLLINFSGIDGDVLYEGGFLDVLYRLAVSFSKDRLSPEDFKMAWSELCRQGRALLIIDGLDELTPDELDDFWISMNFFLLDYPLANVIATSRNTVYDDGFTPYTISRIRFYEQFIRFGQIWFDNYYADAPERAADAKRIIDQNIFSTDTLFSSVPEYFNYRLSYITAESSFCYYALQKGSLDMVMKRYAARRIKTLYEGDVRLMLGYLCTIGCTADHTSFPRDVLEELIELAYYDLRGSFSAEHDTQTVIDALIQNGFLVEHDGEYALSFDQSVIQYICAEAIVNGFAPAAICDDFECFLCDACDEMPEVAVIAAHLDHRFGAMLFDSLLEPTDERDTEKDYLRRAVLSNILCAERNPVSDSQLVRYCDIEFLRDDRPDDVLNVILIMTILHASPNSGILPIIEKRFRDYVSRGENGFSLAYAACLVSGRRGTNYRYDAVDLIDRYIDAGDDAAALALIRLAAAERLALEEESFVQAYGIGYSKAVLSLRAVGFLNDLVTNGFSLRKLLADAVADSLAVGLVSRRDFAVDNNRTAQLLEQGRDELYEALLVYTDVITEPVTTVCSQAVAQRYAYLYRDSRKRDNILYNTGNIINSYRYFKIYAALGCADRAETFRISETLSKEMISPVFMLLPKSESTLFDTDTVVRSLDSDDGIYRLALHFDELNNPYLADLSEEEDPLRIKALLALLLLRGVILKVYTDTDDELMEWDIRKLLDEGVRCGDNLSVIVSVLADMTKQYPVLQIIQDDRFVDEGCKRIHSILKQQSGSDRPLEKQTVDVWLGSYFKEADVYAALLLMKNAYPEFGELIQLTQDDVWDLLTGLMKLLPDKSACLEYPGRLGVPIEDDDAECTDYIVFENMKYIVYVSRTEPDGVVYLGVSDPGVKPVTLQNGKTVNNIFAIEYNPCGKEQQITAPLNTERVKELFASLFDTLNN